MVDPILVLGEISPLGLCNWAAKQPHENLTSKNLRKQTGRPVKGCFL